MIKKVLFIIVFLTLAIYNASAQKNDLKAIEPKNLNIAVSTGIAGVHFFFLPALELKLYNFSIRANYGFHYWNYGIDYEFGKIDSHFWLRVLGSDYSTYLISFHNNIQHSNFCLDICGTIRYNNIFSTTIGVKAYKNRSISVAYKIGVAVNFYTDYSNNYLYIGNNTAKESGKQIFPFGEISVKLYFFRNM